MSHSTPCLLDLIKIVDNVPLDFHQNYAPYYRLILSPDPRPHGYILPETVKLMPWPPFFAIDDEACTVTLAPPPEGVTFSEYANYAFQKAVDDAIEQDIFPVIHKSHSEHFRIIGAKDFVQVERFTATLFGIATRGAHMTCYVRGEDGTPNIWVARRSKSLFSYPGLLDSTVAGGIKATHGPLDCILAESVEEASLSPNLLSSITSAGVITAANRNPRTSLFHGDVIYVYDLELPADAIPKPGDDEVEEFVLMGCDEVVARMLAGEFKPNVCGVMIDFLIRHGMATPEGEKDYVEICQRLRRKLPMPTRADEAFDDC